MNDKLLDAQIQTAIRLPETLLTRVDGLAKRMSQPGMKVTRAEVLRLAAFRGIEQLEGEKTVNGTEKKKR